jgi:hypothetical protein
MSRRLAALKPQLNRIRAWAHEGSTDAWIAHQLETTAEAVRAFRQEHGIERGGPAPLAPITPDSVVEAMLAEEAAALEAGPELSEPEAAGEPEPASEDSPARTPRRRTRRAVADDAVEGPEVAAPAEAPLAAEADEPADEAPRSSSSRRRGGRGGASRAPRAAEDAPPTAEEADEAPPEPEGADAPHEDEPERPARKRGGRRRGRGRGGARGLEARLVPGSVLVLDAAVTADATFQEHWQDAGALRVEVTADAIVLRRIAQDAEPERS